MPLPTLHTHIHTHTCMHTRTRSFIIPIALLIFEYVQLLFFVLAEVTVFLLEHEWVGETYL